MWKILTNNRDFYYIYFIIVVLLILTFFKLHGSSIGIYNQVFYGKDYHDQNLLFGQFRHIRSDEWIVQTPLAISQVMNEFRIINPYLGMGQNMAIFLDIPTFHWSAIFKPVNFSYFILPLEYAYSFKWWFRAALLLISTYLLLLELFKKNFFFAVMGSILLFLSPFIQWWYSVSAIESVSYGLLITWLYIKTLNYRYKWELITYAFLLWYFLVAFLLILYPPFQVSIGWLVAFLMVGYTLQNRQLLHKNKLFYLFLVGSMVVIGAVVVMILFYFDLKDVIEIVMQTEYPGKRPIYGKYAVGHFFSGFFNVALVNENREIPGLLGNQSESSSFFFLAFFLLPVIIVQKIKQILSEKKIDFMVISLALYFLLVLSWLFLRPREIITSLINSGILDNQNYLIHFLWYIDGLVGGFHSLFFFPSVAPNRIIIGLGVANILLLLYFLNFKTQEQKLTLGAIAISLMATLLHIYIAFKYLAQSATFLKSNTEIVLICMFVFLCMVFLLKHLKKAFLMTLLSFSIAASAFVNPLYHGLDLLSSNKITGEIANISKDNHFQDRWIVYDYGFLSNLLAAKGIKVLNSVQTYPNFDLWEKVNPTGNLKYTYNRYAHIFVSTNNHSELVKLFSPFPDQVFIEINPCNKVLDELQVRYIIFNREVSYPCLKKVKQIIYPAMNIIVYERN